MWKGSRTATRKAKREDRLETQHNERQEKAKVRRRDKFCRFPMCGCRKLGLRLEALPEVSHDKHKGMGGDPKGERSTTYGMILLCKHRHQDGIVSRHKGTLRSRYLTPDGCNGPIVWEIDENAIRRVHHGTARQHWIEIARETGVQTWAPFSAKQLIILEKLAGMEV